MEFYFWKGTQQEEVDFVLKQGLRVSQLIQVCMNVEDPKTRNREVRSLLKASDELKCQDLLVLTETAEEEEEVSWFGTRAKVRFVPFWKWLLTTG